MNSVGTVLLSIIMSSLFILIVILLRKIGRNRISMRLQYALWLLVALRLLVFPMPSVESDLSWMKYLQRYEDVMTQKIMQIKIPYLSEMAIVSATVSSSEVLEGDLQASQPPKQVVERNWEITKVPLLWVVGDMIRLGWLIMVLWFVGYNMFFAKYLKKNRMLYEGCKTKLKVYLVEHLPSPCLYGKAIYITPDITTDEKKLQHVIAHEQGHFFQGDMFWSVVRCLCLIVYWWNPLVWVAAYLSKQDCELACDEIAIKTLGEEERISYGETLLSLVCLKTKPKDFLSMSTTMTGSGKSMKQRIQKIVKKTQMIWWIAVVLLVVSGFCFVGVSTQTTSHDEEVVGQYELVSEGYIYCPKLLLQEDGTFSFGYDPLSSYFPYGTYEVADQLVIARTMDGLYHYTFQILNEEQLKFLSEQSSYIQLTQGHSLVQPVKEWGAFQKE